jgi:hypothetical protein
MTKIFNFFNVFSVVHCRSRITFHVGSRGLNETAESDPGVSMRLRNWIPRSQWDRGLGSRGLNETAGSDPAVSMRHRKPIPRSHWDRGNFMTNIFNFIYVFSVVHCRSRITFHVGSRGLNETAESYPAVSMRSRDRFPRSQWDRGNFMTPRESLQKRILVLIPFKGKPS